MMRHNLKYLLAFLISFWMVSCTMGGVNPQKTFDVLGLSLNKIPYQFSQHFNEIRGQIKNGNLTYVAPDNSVKKGVTAVSFIENLYLNMLKKDIEAIKNLKVNEETKPMQAATLDVFMYTQEIYETDMLRIAKMIDEGKSDAKIDAAIDDLQNTKGKIMDQKFNKAYNLVFSYADTHGIEYKILEYPN